jgi:uncharacterized protein (TIGR02246 family)
MKTTFLSGLLIISGLAAASCAKSEPGPAPPPVTPSPSASQEELGKMNRDFAAALNARDAKKAASYYTADAVLYPPGEPPVRGREAIEAYWRGALEQGGIRDASVETIDAKSSGDLGYEIGTFVATVNGPDGQPMTDRGRFVELLRREPDGVWYSTMGMWNAPPPEAK